MSFGPLFLNGLGESILPLRGGAVTRKDFLFLFYIPHFHDGVFELLRYESLLLGMANAIFLIEQTKSRLFSSWPNVTNALCS